VALIDYVTLTELKDTISLSGQTYADADLTLAITAASRAIDHRTRRQFWPADAASARKFTPISRTWLDVGDFFELTSVAWDSGTRVLNTDFYLQPIDGPPWSVLRTTQGVTFPLDINGVTVTAKWGMSAVPAEIKEATKILAVRLARRPREAAFGVAGMGLDAAVYISKYDPDIDLMLAPYMRSPLVG
jgi:hypothetical protein